MARIRTIKPEMFQDEKLAPCDPTTRLVFLGLIAMADDAGRVLDNTRVIDAFIFPETADSSHEPLMRLSGMGRIMRGKTASGQRVIQIVNWDRHQKIQHPNIRAALPEIVEVQEVASSHETLMSDSRGAHETFTHHTNDQRPVPTTSTNDLQGDAIAPRPEKRARASKPTGKPSAGAKYPDFPHADRQAAYATWTEKRGPVAFERLVHALGPCWPPPDTPGRPSGAALLRALGTYCTVVGSGKSAPFASIERAAELLVPITKTQAIEDPIARYDAAFLTVHGHAPKVAA